MEYAVGWDVAIEEERRRGREVAMVLDRSRTDVLEIRQRQANLEAEAARLEQLVSLGQEAQYCRSCDLRMLNLQTLLRALGRTSKAVFADYLHASGEHEVLSEAAESLSMAAHLDT